VTRELTWLSSGISPGPTTCIDSNDDDDDDDDVNVDINSGGLARGAVRRNVKDVSVGGAVLHRVDDVRELRPV